MSGLHSRIAPSGANIWGVPNGCPGWVQMNPHFPDEDTEAARRGTAGHELGQKMIQALTKSYVGFPLLEETLNTEASNGVIYDEEIYEAAHLYAAHCGHLLKHTRVFGGNNLGIESRIEAPSIHPESFGTVDFFIYDKKTNTVYIRDYKQGRLVVEVVGNLQLVNYAAGLIFGRVPSNVLSETVFDLGIVQPLAFHEDGPERVWRITYKEILPYIKQLADAALVATGDHTFTRSGGHCRYCNARHGCKAAIKAGLGFYESVSDSLPTELDMDALAVLYTLARRGRKHLESLETAFKEQMEHSSRAGKEIPGFRPEPKEGRVTWTLSNDELINLCSLSGFDVRKTAVLTPTQARAQGLDPKMISAITERPNLGMKLVADDGSKARKVFTK